MIVSKIKKKRRKGGIKIFRSIKPTQNIQKHSVKFFVKFFMFLNIESVQRYDGKNFKQKQTYPALTRQIFDVHNKANLSGNRDHVRVAKLYPEIKTGSSFMERCLKIIKYRNI